MKDKSIDINSSINEITDAKESVFWLDIVRELTMWKKGFELELKSMIDDIASNNPSTASVLTHLGDLNGRIKTVDYLISLPDIFIQILEEQKDNDT